MTDSSLNLAGGQTGMDFVDQVSCGILIVDVNGGSITPAVKCGLVNFVE